MASVARKNVPFCIPELADYSLRSLPNRAIICAVRAFPRDCVDFLRDWPSRKPLLGVGSAEVAYDTN